MVKKSASWHILIFCLLLGFAANHTTSTAQAGPKKKKVVYYTASSLQPYLQYALHHDYCYPIKDAFQKRSCKKQWKAFRSKLFRWVKRVWIVDNVEITIHQYDFKRRAFRIEHSANIITNSEFDVRGKIVIGKGRCDKMTGLAEVGQILTIKMKPKKAEAHPLRRAAGTQNANVLMKGRLGTVNWCCNRYMKRAAKRMKENCKPPVFLYTIKGVSLDNDEDFLFNYNKGIEKRSFDPAVLGGYIPTGGGDFEKSSSKDKKESDFIQ